MPHIGGQCSLISKLMPHSGAKFLCQIPYQIPTSAQGVEGQHIDWCIRIQYLAFGYYLVVLNDIFGFGSAKTIL